MDTPRPLAQKFIEDYHVQKGKTISFLVTTHDYQNLPPEFVDNPDPTRIDLLGGRPTNVVCTQEGFSADLCFQGPPQSCLFKWIDVFAVSLDPAALNWDVLIFPATAIQMENNAVSVVIHTAPKEDQGYTESVDEAEVDDAEEEATPPTKKERPSFLKVVK